MGLTRRLRDATGLDLDTASVERAVRERMQKTGTVLRIDYDPPPGSAEFEALVDLVVVPESWILRDPAVFETALRCVQRRLLTHPGRPVRVLSLPCAGGEEPYSLAMLLARAGIGPSYCRIDGVDLSQAAIARARAGRYTKNAFRGPDQGLRTRFFTQDGDDCVIGPEPRAYVHFAQGNLFDLDPARSGQYDLVFCRNLLIYFDTATQARAASHLRALLADDGLLLAGYAETPALCRHGFVHEGPRDTFALRKSGWRTAAAMRPEVRPGMRAAVRATLSPAPVRARAPAQALPHAAPAAAPAAAPVAAPVAAPMAAPAAEPGAAPVAAAGRQPRAAVPDAAALLAEAKRHADAGRLEQAEAACRAALALRADDAQAWFLLGLTAEVAGRLPDAERCWRRCVYLDPDHYEALCALALLLEGRSDAAGADLRRRAARVYARRGSVSA